MESKIAELEDELEEEQSNSEQLSDRIRRLTAQVCHLPAILLPCFGMIQYNIEVRYVH